MQQAIEAPIRAPHDIDDYILGAPGPGLATAIPRRGIHIMSGPSGGGKTMLLCQMLAAMQKEEPFLNYPTKNVPLSYATLDRPIEDMHDSMAKAGIPLDTFPTTRYVLQMPESERGEDYRTKAIIMAMLNKTPRAKLLVIDGFSMLCSHGKVNDYLQSAVWLQSTTDLIESFDVCLIGVVHSPKPDGKRVLKPRQTILGSSAQGGSCGTVIYMEEAEPLVPTSPKRIMHLCPRNLPPDLRKMRFVHPGILISDAKGMEEDEKLVLDYVAAQSSGVKGSASADDIEDCMSKNGISRRSVFRVLASLVKNGAILKVKHGEYKIAGGHSAPLNTEGADMLPWMQEGVAAQPKGD